MKQVSEGVVIEQVQLNYEIYVIEEVFGNSKTIIQSEMASRKGYI